jgi:hypothetical protein
VVAAITVFMIQTVTVRGDESTAAELTSGERD